MASFTVESLAKMEQQETASADNEAIKQKQNRDRAKKLAKAISGDEKKAEKDAAKEAKASEERLKRILQWKIRARAERFPETLNDIPLPAKNASLAELEEIDDLQKQERQLNGGEQRLEKMVRIAAPMFEGFWGDGTRFSFLPQEMRLNLKGLGQAVNAKDSEIMAQLKPLIAETIIEHPEIASSNLAWRWAETILTTFYCFHLCNTNPKIKEKMEELKRKAALQIPTAPTQAPSSTAS